MNHWSKNHSLQEQASDVVRKHMVITGLVQGVGFRYFTVIQARQLGVSGWVRNRYDGSVEVEAQGSQESVQVLVKQQRRCTVRVSRSRVAHSVPIISRYG